MMFRNNLRNETGRSLLSAYKEQRLCYAGEPWGPPSSRIRNTGVTATNQEDIHIPDEGWKPQTTLPAIAHFPELPRAWWRNP